MYTKQVCYLLLLLLLFLLLRPGKMLCDLFHLPLIYMTSIATLFPSSRRWFTDGGGYHLLHLIIIIIAAEE